MAQDRTCLENPVKKAEKWGLPRPNIAVTGQPAVLFAGLVRTLLQKAGMETAYCSVVRDGEQMFVAVPENKTLQFYQYLRGYGLCFTVDCRGFCEDNVFSFPEGEDMARLNAIVGKFPLN
jgi:hypothetical protein